MYGAWFHAGVLNGDAAANSGRGNEQNVYAKVLARELSFHGFALRRRMVPVGVNSAVFDLPIADDTQISP